MNSPLILVAEDTPDLLMVLLDFLEMEGYRVHTCADGQNAWDYLTHCHRCPDLIISDIMMPRMGGIELLKKLKTEDKTKQIPCMVYSSSAHFKREVESLGHKFVAKPFDIDELLEAIQTTIKSKGDL